MCKTVAVVIVLMCTAGCASLSQHPLVKPADMFVNEQVGPEYEQYVMNDPALSPQSRELRLKTVRLFRELVEDIKNSK